MKRLKTAVLVAALAAAPLASAQEEPEPRLSYGEHVEELAGVLGGAHYLRILCSGREDQRWREFMRGVIAREPSRSADLSRAFNDGYREQEARYPDCSAQARNTEAELRAQGLRLADGLRAWNAE